MWLRIFGPVRAGRDGVELELGSPQQRSLFAVLVAGAGAPVGFDTIANVLWGDKPPVSAAATVQQYVSRLRRILEPQRSAYGPGTTIRRAGGGYQVVADGLVDVLQWRALMAEARHAAERGDRVAAAAAYEKALELWLGPVAADLPRRVRKHPLFAALEREHAVVLTEAADLALAAGRTNSLVTQLERAVELHRFDEGLHARLIRILAAEGRRADALRHFDDVRRRLAAALGLHPGLSLQEAHRIALAETAAPATLPLASRPAQLPSGLRSFSGRETELHRLDALANGALPLVVVSGMGGSGKTSLALRWAHQVAADFPDGQLFVDLRGFAPRNTPVEPVAALRGFLEALGVPRENHPADADEIAALYRSVLTGRRVLVVLDNARDDEQVRPLLPGGPGCAVIVTSRSHLGGLLVKEGAGSVELGVFSDPEAQRFLRSRLGDRVDAEPRAAAEIIDLCGGLPLALAICAAWVQHSPTFTLTAVAAELRDRDRLDAFTPVAHDGDLRTVFSWSYQRLSTGAAELFRRLGVQPGTDAAAALAASITGRAAAATGHLLAELVDAHLLAEVKPARYSMHDLVRSYAAELGDAGEHEETIHRAINHQLHSLLACTRAAYPHQNAVDSGAPLPGISPWTPADKDEARAWFSDEHENVLAALDAAERRGLDRFLWLFSWCLHCFLGEQMGRWDEVVAVHRRALAAAERQGESWWRSYLHNSMAGCYAELADQEQAFRQVEMAAQVGREMGDTVRTATSLIGMAALLVEYGTWPTGEQIERAAAFADEALALSETFDPASSPDRREADEARLRQLRVAACEYTGYRILHRTGDLAAAVAEMERAVALARIEGIEREPLLLETIARFQSHAGADAEAIQTYERAIAMQPNDVWPTVQRLAAMAACHARLGDHKAVYRLHDRVRQHLDGIHHPSAVRLRAQLDELESALTP